MISQSFLLSDKDNLDSLFASIDRAVSRINENLGTAFGYTSVEDHGHAKYYFWHEVIEGLSHIRLVNDFDIPARYVEVTVPTTLQLKQIENVLASELTILNVEKLKEAAHTEANVAKGTLIRLGIGAQGPLDPEVQQILEAGLRSLDTSIRNGAILAIFLLKWPQFLPELRFALNRESDPDLQARLAYTVELLESL